MITLVTGKPGDGKTLYGTGLIADIIEKTDYFVVSNISLLLGRLHEELRRRKWEGNLDGRVRVIEHGESFEFYRYRAGGLVLDHSPDWLADEQDGAKRMPKREFDRWFIGQFHRLRGAERWRRPVCYFIDEAHEFFPSREWMKVGRGVSYYATKHRHLHDEVFLITQVPEQLDSALRRLVSETHVIRNNLRRSVGPFRLRPVFRVRKWYGMPVGNVEPFATETFHLDPDRIAGCYKTASAFGDVVKGGEKITNKAKLPWWALWVFALGGGGLLIAGIFLMPQLIIGKVSAGVAGGSDLIPGQPTQFAAKKEVVSTSGSVVETLEPEKKVTGVLIWEGSARVTLSDGSVYTSRNGLEIVAADHVRVNGVDYTW